MFAKRVQPLLKPIVEMLDPATSTHLCKSFENALSSMYRAFLQHEFRKCEESVGSSSSKRHSKPEEPAISQEEREGELVQPAEGTLIPFSDHNDRLQASDPLNSYIYPPRVRTPDRLSLEMGSFSEPRAAETLDTNMDPNTPMPVVAGFEALGSWLGELDYPAFTDDIDGLSQPQ